MKKIEIIRRKGFYGKARTLRLFVDGEEIDGIADGQTIYLALSPDARSLWGRMDWGKTTVFDLSTTRSGDTIDIESSFSLNPFSLLGIAPIPLHMKRRRGSE